MAALVSGSEATPPGIVTDSVTRENGISNRDVSELGNEQGFEVAEAPAGQEDILITSNSQSKAPISNSETNGVHQLDEGVTQKLSEDISYDQDGEDEEYVQSGESTVSDFVDSKDSLALSNEHETAQERDITDGKDETGPTASNVPDDQLKEAKKTSRDFFFVRVPRADTTQLFSALKGAEDNLSKARDRQKSINVALQEKQAARAEAYESLKTARARLRECQAEVQNKYNEAKPLQEVLKKHQEAGSAAKSRGRDLQCSSEQELNQRIAQIDYNIQHESMTLPEEKKLLVEMKKLEASRAEVRSFEVLRSNITDSHGQREAVQSRLKPIMEEVEVLKLEREAAKKICETFEAEAKTLEDEVKGLLEERSTAYKKQDAAFEVLKAARKRLNQEEYDYKKNRRDSITFYQLANAKNIAALEEFCHQQIESIHEKLNGDDAYRAAYQKNNRRSTVRRFRSLDTRRPNPDEDVSELMRSVEVNPGNYRGGPNQESRVEPTEAAAPLSTEIGAEVNGGKLDKQFTETEVAVPAFDIGAEKVEAESNEAKAVDVAKAKKQGKQSGSKPALSLSPDDDFIPPPILRKPIEQELSEASALKEKKREEELEKARKADERKKKLAEKAAAKAEVARAKEAEDAAKRREKERERRARRKAAGAGAGAGAVVDDEAAENEGGSTEAADDAVAEKEITTTASGKSGEEVTEISRRQRKRAAKGKVPPVTRSIAPPFPRKRTSFPTWVYTGLVAIFLALIAIAVIAYVRSVPVVAD